MERTLQGTVHYRRTGGEDKKSEDGGEEGGRVTGNHDGRSKRNDQEVKKEKAAGQDSIPNEAWIFRQDG